MISLLDVCFGCDGEGEDKGNVNKEREGEVLGFGDKHYAGRERSRSCMKR